jgi:uncharacterized iron-regulated membrane protein
VVAGLFILNMAVSGIFLAYEHPLIRWSEQSQLTVAVPPDKTRLDVETLIARARQARPQARFFRMVSHADPAATVGFFDTGENSTVLYLNPYTGDVVGDGQQAVRQFFHFMTGWHRWLALSGDNRSTGKALTGAISLTFFGMLLSGLCLWLPKEWSAKSLRQIVFFRSGLKGKARDWNWHNVVGIWWTPLILITTLTGILMSYAWAQNLLYTVTGESPPVQRASPPKPKPKLAVVKPAPAPQLNPAGLNRILPIAEAQWPGWKSITIILPNSADSPVSFYLTATEDLAARPDLGAELVLERAGGAVLKWEPYETKPMGARLRTWVTPIHTGEIGGLIGETVAALSACGAILLAWTGLSLAWRRFLGRDKISLDAFPRNLPKEIP